jgi:hypothetical protein
MPYYQDLAPPSTAPAYTGPPNVQPPSGAYNPEAPGLSGMLLGAQMAAQIAVQLDAMAAARRPSSVLEE